MKILALDLATKTGWGIAHDGKLVESGVQDFSPKRGESPGMRFLMFRRWLEKMVGPEFATDVDLIVFEQAHHRGGAPTEVGVGLSTHTMSVAASVHVDYATVHTGTLKKFAAGHGKAPKLEMIVAARKFWDITPTDDNHADALCVLAWAVARYDMQVAR